jgi:UDP-2,3-diacylglucosamine pyrophosphatase LpxH
VDLLVLGTHGRTGIKRFFLGSVTERVLQLASSPVLSIKLDRELSSDLRWRDVVRADQALVVFSDVEMGPGGDTDDFPNTSWLAELFLAYNLDPWADVAVDLVFNGDTFDLLKTPVDGRFTHLVDEAVALAKMDRVIAAHPAFFRGLTEFLGHRRAPRRVFFVVGNHDYELLFPAVQDAIRGAIGAPSDTVVFPGFDVNFGDVHVEHGSQADPLFRIAPEEPLIPWNGGAVLNLPWGAVALIDVAMPLHGVLYPCDRARPIGRVLGILPEVRALLLDRYWQYWTRDWLSAWWSASDPMKQISWTMFRQVASRLQSGDAAVRLDPQMADAIAAGPHRVVLLGHLHDAAWYNVDGTKVLRTGCMRDEFLVGEDGAIGAVREKVYAEVLLQNGAAFRSHLVEVSGVPGTAAAMPASILDVLAPVRAMRVRDTGQDQADQIDTESRR